MTDLTTIEDMADWSPWIPFEETLATALVPSVVTARQGTDSPVVDSGMAGERARGETEGPSRPLERLRDWERRGQRLAKRRWNGAWPTPSIADR
jgi:hypothetical protein